MKTTPFAHVPRILSGSIMQFMAPDGGDGGNGGGGGGGGEEAASESPAGEPTGGDDDGYLSFLPGGSMVRDIQSERAGDKKEGEEEESEESEDDDKEEESEESEDDDTEEEEESEDDDEDSEEEESDDDDTEEEEEEEEEELTEREKKLKAENERLKKEAAKKEPEPKPEPRQISTLDDVESVEDLHTLADKANKLIKMAVELWDGGTVKNDKGEDVEITAQAARKMFNEQTELVRMHIPRRMAELETGGRFEAAAQEAYPWMKDAESPENQNFAALAKAIPGLKRFAPWKLFVADAVAGRSAREAKAKKKTPAGGDGKQPKPKPSVTPKTKPTSKPPSGGAGERKPPVGKSRRDTALKNLLAVGGSRSGLEAFVAATHGG